jgi:hypothetical protein
MKNSSIEITEQEYLIKLNKDDFDLSFINQLLKRIQAQQFFTFKSDDYEEDIVSRKSGNDLAARFDHLSEK